MKAIEAIRNLNEYLIEEQIEHYPILSIDGSESPILYMVFKSQHSPAVPLEGEVFFHENCAEIRCYYGEQISACIRDSSHRTEIYEMINYINARVFPYSEVVYSSDPNYLFTPRMYITADSSCDLTITTIVDYRVWELLDDDGSDELYEYITHYCPRFLDLLAVPFLGLLSERTTVTGAISYIEHTIIEG